MFLKNLTLAFFEPSHTSKTGGKMKENEIRPKELFQQYLELSKSDAKAMLNELTDIRCPGCNSETATKVFEKNGYTFKKCQDCASLFCSPRPQEESLKNLYRSSKSANFWSEVFFPAVAESRREKLFKKKAIEIRNYLQEKSFLPASICDVGAGYGLFLEELKAILPEADYYAIEPNQRSNNVCVEKGFKALAKTAEDACEWAGLFDLVISQEVLEHVFSPMQFVSSLFRLTKPCGFCLVTCLGYEGFDILFLQENSNSVFPPHHLNFLSISGFETLFKRAGFSSVDIITPGELDVDIAINGNQDNEFLKTLSSRGEEAIRDFQTLLKKHKMSSHVWVFAQK